MIVEQGTMVRDAEGEPTWALTDLEADAINWYREHMMWAFRASTVAQGVRAQLAMGGMPANIIELALTDVVVELIENGFTG